MQIAFRENEELTAIKQTTNEIYKWLSAAREQTRIDEDARE